MTWSVGNQLVVHTRSDQGKGAGVGQSLRVRAHEVRRDHAVRAGVQETG